MKTAKKIALYIALVFVVLAFFSLVASIRQTGSSSARPSNPTSSDSEYHPEESDTDSETDTPEREVKYFYLDGIQEGIVYLDGMTWQEWINAGMDKSAENSPYMPSVVIDYGSIQLSESIGQRFRQVLYLNDSQVSVNAKIVENAVYHFVGL